MYNHAGMSNYEASAELEPPPFATQRSRPVLLSQAGPDVDIEGRS